jgi:hypothetical protein
LLAAGGALGCLHATPFPPPWEQAACCFAVPKCARDQVFVFFLQGLDPLDLANLRGFRAGLHHLGFPKTYYGQCYHAAAFAREVRAIREREPEARFVLVGRGYGVRQALALAEAVRGDGVQVDLLVSLDGDAPEGKPENVGRVVELCGFGVANHAATLQLLAEELAAVATTVPVTEVPSLRPPAELDPSPTPRPVTPAAEAAPGEWDFLKPVPYLGPAPGARP